MENPTRDSELNFALTKLETEKFLETHLELLSFPTASSS